MTFGPGVPGFGPTPARIALVGEHPGSEESEALRPFVGMSGRELRSQLRTIGVNLDDCYRTNVFSRQPDSNNIALYGVDRGNASPASLRLGLLTSNPITYCADEWLHELERLRAELSSCGPNIIIALGNTATWALGLGQGINNLRGAIHVSHFLPSREVKVLPTFHPAAVLRQWDTRVIALADLEKAHVESRSPNFNYDNTELWLAPTLDDLSEFGREFMFGSNVCATDVETKRGQITCVSFSPRSDKSITVPFWIEGSNPNYWSVDEEIAALKWCAQWIESPTITKVLQNGLYDIQYFIRYGMKPRNFTADTMLAHHSLYSEMRKGLGFLGSVYTNTQNWKSLRTFSLEENLKRDD